MYIVNTKYNKELKLLLYSIYCKVYIVFVSEFPLVPCADLLDFWCVNNSFEMPCTRTFHEIYTIFYLQCQSIINVILLTSAGVFRLSITWKESKIGLFQSFFFPELGKMSVSEPFNLTSQPVSSPLLSIKNVIYFLFQDYLKIKNHEKKSVKIRHTFDPLHVHVHVHVHVSLVFSDSHYSTPSCDHFCRHGG